MAQEPFAQRIERLVQERNVPALLAETQQLLTLYLAGDDNLNLEPITSALSILQRIGGLQRAVPMPADRHTLAPGRRFRVTEVVVYEFRPLMRTQRCNNSSTIQLVTAG